MTRRTLVAVLTLAVLAGSLILSMSRGTTKLVAADVIGAFGFHAKEYAEQGVAFAYLNVGPQDREERIREDMATLGFEGPYIPDPKGRIGAHVALSRCRG